MESNHANSQKTHASAPGKVADIHTAAKIIRDRGVVIYPTETVYGIGVDALSGTAVKKVFAIKKRSSPVSLAVSGYGMIPDVSVCDADTMELIRKLLPGPITVILPKKPVVPDILTAGSDRVGIRYPDHETTVRLIELSGTPVTSTSANLPGEPPAREVCEISEDVLDGADCVIDGGRCEYGVASTVVDLVDMQILRKGAGYEQAARCLR